MKEFVIKMSDKDYEYFLGRAEMIVDNFKKAGSKDIILSPEQTVELAVRSSLMSHIGNNLLNFLAESERKLEKSTGKMRCKTN